MAARMPTKPSKSRKRTRSGSLVEEPSSTSHAPHVTRMKVDHGRPQDCADRVLESTPLVKSELVKPVKTPPPKKKKGHHHMGSVSMETGATTMDNKSKSADKGARKRKARLHTVSAQSVLTAGTYEKPASGVSSKVTKRPYVPDLSSDEDDFKKVDITTPPDADKCLSVSLKKSLIRLNTFDATKQDQPASYTVSISRETLPRPRQKGGSKRGVAKPITAVSAEMPEPKQIPVPESPGDSGSYHVAFDGTPTKMIFRSRDRVGDDAIGGVAREKKSKKKHKKHPKKSRSRVATQDTDGTCQDTAEELQDTSGAGQDTGKVWYNTDSLKVRIKL